MARVFIAADHAGFALKKHLIEKMKNVTFVDLGPSDASRVDYPDFAEKLAIEVSRDPKALGVLVCGSGIGMSIAANKVAGIRAAVVESVTTARLSREHNHANVLCLGARILGPELAEEIVSTWLATEWSKEGRHQNRVEKINQLDKK